MKLTVKHDGYTLAFGKLGESNLVFGDIVSSMEEFVYAMYGAWQI